MNSSTQHITNIILDSSIITLSSISLCISTGLLGFIIYNVIKRKNSPHRVALLLTANLYLALIFSCILTLLQYGRVLSGRLYQLKSLNDGIYCQIRAYFQWVSICGIYYSNSLQSIYRLCRVVFYTKQSLQSFQLYQILIIIQWILCFLIMIPILLLGDFEYLVNDYLCQFGYSNLRSIMISSAMFYFIPMCITAGCYVYTLNKTRRGNNNLIHRMTRVQQLTARRDLVVLFRICILFGILIISSIPGVIMFLIYIFTGYHPWWSVQMEWLAFSLSTINVTIVLAVISPHVWNLWRKNLHNHRHTAVEPANVRIG